VVTPIDARVGRLEQGAVAIVLLAGFVFGTPYTIPAAGLLCAADAVLGPHGPVPAVWTALLADRLGPPRRTETASAARLQSLVVTGALALAMLVLLAGAEDLATLVALAVAVVAALETTGLFSVGAELDRRGRRH